MFNILVTVISVIVIAGALWHLFSFVRYVRSGEYETDKRLWEISE